MHEFDWQLALTLGMLLSAALLAGGIASRLHVPRVTAYLVVGCVLGHPQLNLLPERHIGLLEPLTKLAIALVLFTLGCHFPLARARRILGRVLKLSAGELSATFVLVTIGMLAVGMPLNGALLLGALALATAPATTILVLKETESEGPVTEYTNALVALNNMVSIVLFELLFLGVMFSAGALETGVAACLGNLVQDLVGSVVLGVLGGLVVSYFFGLLADTRRLVLLIAVIVLLLAICRLHDMPYLLTFLAMGVTVANSSDETRGVLGELDQLTGLLCVVFFVAHGAELKLEHLGKAGLAGFVYIVMRLAGKCFGTNMAATMTGEEPMVRRWLGTTLTAQAGAAIALVAIAVHRTEGRPALHEMCLDLQAVILGTVVVFELIGPILIRHSVLAAGEVPVAHAVRHQTTGIFEQARTVINRIRIAMGISPWQDRSAEALTVRELMRKNVQAIKQDATFNEVLSEIEHSRDNTYPVVGPSGELVGVIRYRELSNAMFDPALGGLVRAADVTTAARWILHPDESVTRACELFEATKDDCLTVVTRDRPFQYVGLVRRRDLLRFFIWGQKENRSTDEDE